MNSEEFIAYVARWIRERALTLAVINGMFGWACVIYILRYGR